MLVRTQPEQGTSIRSPATEPDLAAARPTANRLKIDKNPPQVPQGNLVLEKPDAWRETSDGNSFSRFVQWVDTYLATPEAQREPLERTGIELARERREALRQLIESDPERALALAVPQKIRRVLPSDVVTLLEERVAGRGDLDTLAALPEPGKQVVPVFRRAYLNGREFKAFVYGRRLGTTTLQNIPLHGVAVDDLLAVNENPVRILEPEEAADAQQQLSVADPLCAISKLPSGSLGEQTVVAVGDEIIFLCGARHADDLNAQLVKTETTDFSDPQASAYTEGQKRLILIRVDFPDLTGTPFSDTTGTNLVNTLNNFYRDCSYHRTGFSQVGQGSDYTPTFRMTNSASYYGTNDFYNALRNEARAAATSAGYVLTNYEFDAICFGAVPGWTWAGLGRVGAPGAWLRNSFGGGVAAHELGHNFGLNHANFWDTSGASVIGPGTSVEYGDSFDTMGAANAGSYQFNARYKNYLNWLTSTEVATYSTNGTYRIYAHDNTNSTGIRGLKIAKNTGTNYWVEFRQKFTGNKWLMSGAGLRWAQSGNQKSHLLDTTPGSPDSKNDAAIVIGRTFSDWESGIHITPIRKGGTSPESLDVVVYKGSFPTNVPPAVIVDASVTNASVGTTLSFSASASDSNGDALAYYWDFGDANFGTNGAAASKSWSNSGEYVVRCTVTDMRGGTASDSVLVRIGSPTTYRISGRVMSGANGVHGVRVYASSTRVTYTDTDGTYTITGLPAGSYTIGASLYPYTYSALGFTNPVSVGPNAANIDFYDVAGVVPPQITAQPQSQSVLAGTNATFTVTATGTALRYQWRFQTTNIVNATNSAYTITNVQLANTGAYSVVINNSVGSVASATAQLSIIVPPVLASIPNVTIDEGLPLTFTATATGSGPGVTRQITDFETFASGTSSGYVFFRSPNYSPSTTAFLDALPNISSVTNTFPSGNTSTRALYVNCSFKTGTTAPWLRLTTFGATSLPNPTVDFSHALRFDLYTDRALQVGLGLRETSTSANIGADGGSSGPIEFVGVVSTNGGAPQPSRTVAAGSWTNLQFNLPSEPLAPFTGNGILESSTGKGVLECLALVPVAGSGAYNIYLDNFTLIEPHKITYSLNQNSPAGATIDRTTGAFSWTPTEAQGPGTYSITVRATDNSPGAYSDSKTFTVTVREVNVAPVLATIADRTVHPGNVISFTNAASDADIPANTVTFGLGTAPENATVDPNTGVFTWIPVASDAGTNSITLRVTDNGSPSLASERMFNVVVVLPTFAPATVSSGNLSLSWSAISGKTYRIQYKNNLDDSSWSDLGDVVANSATATLSDVINVSQKFYRIIALD